MAAVTFRLRPLHRCRLAFRSRQATDGPGTPLSRNCKAVIAAMTRSIPYRATALSIVLLAVTGPVAAGWLLPDGDVPLPRVRPAAAEIAIDTQATGTVPVTRVSETLGEQQPGKIETLKAGLDALASDDMTAARAIRDLLARNSPDWRILAWAIALRGGADVPSSEIAAAVTALPEWPGMTALRRNSERALARENPPAAEVIAAFSAARPLTIEGAIVLARAHVALGRQSDAAAVLAPLWRAEKLDGDVEIAVLSEFGKVIPRATHCYRMERMMYEDRIRSAERVANRCGRPRLQEAWAAVVRQEKDAYRLLSAVPESERTAGYTYALARYLRRAEKFRDAAATMAKAPRNEEALIDPDQWWIERRVLSRELIDIGEYTLAYRTAAGHAAESPAMAADAEFHAGWYALQFRKDAQAAARHFEKIAQIADGPISKARALYWMARAAEAGGPGNARAYYEQAARYGTAFYGQIAAEKLGRKALTTAFPKPSAADRRRFEARDAVRAIKRIEAAGHPGRADALYRDLARELDNPGELAQLAAMAEKRGDHFLALRVGKIAASRGIDIGTLAHPMGVIPSSADLSSAGKALAYAVARQESEFNVGAVSPAGARGLLQLMPATARSVARKAGLAYSATRLTSDAAYNALLGSNYLAEQLLRFDGSYVLTFAGYNAGPRKAEEWMTRFGDPRGKSLETVIDWIERIPYAETRNYVQRVMENYQVYKQRITGQFGIIGDLRNGR